MTKPAKDQLDQLDQAAADGGWTPGTRRTWGLAYRKGDEQIDVNLNNGRFAAARRTAPGQPPRRLGKNETLKTLRGDQ